MSFATLKTVKMIYITCLSIGPVNSEDVLDRMLLLKTPSQLKAV